MIVPHSKTQRMASLHETVTSLAQLPVYSINRPKPESRLDLIILSEVKEGKMKKSASMEQLEEGGGLIDKDLPIVGQTQ